MRPALVSVRLTFVSRLTTSALLFVLVAMPGFAVAQPPEASSDANRAESPAPRDSGAEQSDTEEIDAEESEPNENAEGGDAPGLQTDEEPRSAATDTSDGESSRDDTPVEAPTESEADYPDDASDPYGDEAPAEPDALRYFLEGIDVEGNDSTSPSIIRSFCTLNTGDVIDPEGADLESIEWRLLGTGWFNTVELHLRRGSRRHWVRLVIEVKERNTLTVSSLILGVSEGLSSGVNVSQQIYGGLTLTETNLFGTGARVDLTAVGSLRSQGARLSYAQPGILPRNLTLRAGGFFNNSREFYGHSPLVSGTCEPEDTRCESEERVGNAVLFYQRGGLWLGLHRALNTTTSFTLDWQGELLNVSSRPDAASERRGSEVRAIDFAVASDDISRLSMLRFQLAYDRRNDPVLPTRGLDVRFGAEFAHRILGSEYDFIRLQLQYQGWIPLGQNHTLRGGVYLGAVFGRAPFYMLFHVSDLTDFIPSRVLEMQLDRRAPPNAFSTSISAMRAEEVAGRIDLEYQARLFRGHRSVRSIIGYVNLGLFTLGDPRDYQFAISGFDGIQRIPFDLTFDVGLRIDTSVGVFQLGFSNLLGFIQL